MPIYIPGSSSPAPAPSSIQLGRLLIGPALSWEEPNGDPIGGLGGAVVPAARQVYQANVTIATMAADGQSDTLADRQRIRRQLRGLLNNDQLKLQGFFYVVVSSDGEQDGWYAPAPCTFQDPGNGTAPATGFWQAQSQWSLLGRQRTHREARQVWMKDLRTGSYDRDTLGWVRSTDFTALPALALTVLPNGATSAALTVSGQAISGAPLPTGRDTGQCSIVQGLSDLQVVSYERPETALNLSDVIVYDRRGQLTAPGTGPDTSWEEVYGADHQWSWVNAATPIADAPVLDNGLVRVRWDATNTPGFRVDVWNGAVYVEQGKMLVQRVGDSTGLDNTWVSAGLHTENGYTPERAVASIVLSRTADAYSRERVFITVQRGELGVTFEVYPALKSNGAQADVALQWTPALNAGVADLNQSVAKIDSQGSGSWTPGAAGTAVYAATAGTGAGSGNSGQFGGAYTALGNANFTTSENWAAILRCPTAYATVGAYQTTLSVLQAAGAIIRYAGSDSNAYGTATDSYRVSSQGGAGYVQCQVSFAATASQQVMECESMALGTGSTVGGSGAASGAAYVQSQRAVDTVIVSQANWLAGLKGVYRVFLRCLTTSSNMNVYAKTAATTGATVTVVPAGTPTYQWVDLGEITADGSTLEIHGWLTAATPTGVMGFDRVESPLVQDRTRTAAIYSGARDAGQAALYDSRALGALVTR